MALPSVQIIDWHGACPQETLRLLKAGAPLGCYEWCLTDLFDPENRRHVELKHDIELGGGVQDLYTTGQVDDALRRAGFEIVESRDLATQARPGIPWFQPLVGSGWSFASFRSSTAGRVVTHGWSPAVPCTCRGS